MKNKLLFGMLFVVLHTMGVNEMFSSGLSDYLTAQQQKVITGVVTDSKGELLPGVTVQIKGMGIGTVTDENGRYSLNNVTEESTLEFSYIGMNKQEIIVGNKTTIDVVFVESNIGLEEVVVVGYGVQKKVNLTGAVDQIGSKTFENIAVPNISVALQGAIPNLNINYTSGRPNSNPAWNVRGLTSIGAGGEALILIDGVAGDPRHVNPNDVESVTVLKDAASASIYGSRGAFGVILITTKNPEKSAKPKITFSAGYSFNTPVNKPDVVTDGYTWAKM